MLNTDCWSHQNTFFALIYCVFRKIHHLCQKELLTLSAKVFWLSTHQNPPTSHDVLVSSVKSSLRNFSTTKPFYWFLFSPRPLCQSNCSKLQQNHRCNSGQFTQCTQIMQQTNKQNKHHVMERTHVPRCPCCLGWHQLQTRTKIH